jgi:hypothetical protein
MSHGHMSKVERGEYGRPVTPAVLNAYQRVLGVEVAAVIAGRESPPPPATRWRPGDLTPYQRRAYTSQVAAIAVGAPPGRPPGLLLQQAGPVAMPSQLTSEHFVSLQQTAELLHGIGGLAGNLAHVLLRWVMHLPINQYTEPCVLATITALARRAARGAVELGRHEPARTLYLVALDAATASGDLDLSGGVLADIAEHYLACIYREECLTIIRLAEGDERLSEDVRSVLKEIRNRAEAAPEPADRRGEQEHPPGVAG